MVADSIGRASLVDLVRIGATLRSRAVPGSTGLDGTPATSPAIGDGEDANANVLVATSHDGEIVSRSLNTCVCAVAELEESLVVPLPRGTPLGVTGEAHAGGLERSHDGLGAFGGDVDGCGLLDHLEVAGDLVQSELLGPLALVHDDDFEVVLSTGIKSGGVVVEGGYSAGGECQECGKGQPGEMHDCWIESGA